MAALPYIQLYIADYFADTMHLSTEEHGAYLLLIFNYWQTGKPLRNDNRRLASVARLSNERWQDVKETLQEFFNVTETEWQHERINEDLAAVKSKSVGASKAGLASAAAKKAKKLAKINRKATEKINIKSTSCNVTSTNVERTLNKRCKDVATESQRNVNHTDTDTDTDTDISKKASAKKNRRFIKPTVDELIAEFSDRVHDPTIQVNKFLNHYESNGWRVGKNPMKSWQHAVTNWITRSSENANNDRDNQPAKLSTVDRANQEADEYLESLKREARNTSRDDHVVETVG